MDAEVLGFAAGALGMIAFIPQAIHIRKTGVTDGLSMSTSLCFLAALALWTAYGALTGSASLVTTNAFQIAVQLYILRKVRANARAPPALPLEALGFRAFA